MASGSITTSADGPIGTLTIINVDRRNAMNMAIYQAVPPAIQKLTADPVVRTVNCQAMTTAPSPWT